MEAAGILTVTFGLGYVLQSANSGLVAVARARSGPDAGYFRLRGVIQGPRQFTLFLFFITISLWSILQFLVFLFLKNAPCGMVAMFSVIFEQCSRTLIFCLGMWAVRGPIHNGAEKAVLVLTTALRAALAVTVVAFTRTAFFPVCYPQPSITIPHARIPGIVLLGFDGVMLAIMLLRAWGQWKNVAQKNGGKSTQGMALFLVVMAMNTWSLASLPYVLRLGSIFVRATPQIVTLSILLVLLRRYPDVLWFLHDRGADSSDNNPQGRMLRLGSNGSIMPPGAGFTYHSNPDIEARHGGRTYSNVFRSIAGREGGPHPGTAVAWSVSDSAGDAGIRVVPQSSGGNTHHIGVANISGSILASRNKDDEQFQNVRTVSLNTAAEVERARIDAQYAREEETRRAALAAATGGNSNGLQTIVTAATTTPRTIASFAGLPTPDLRGTRSIRGTVALPRLSAMNPQPNTQGLGIDDQLSPQSQLGDRMYRISANTFSTEDDAATTTTYGYAASQFALGVPPVRTVARGGEASVGDQRVMLVRNIEYDDPALVRSVLSQSQQTRKEFARTTGRFTRSSSGVLRRSPPAPTQKPKLAAVEEGRVTPVMERKRPARRDSVRAIFPREAIQERTSSLSALKQMQPPPPPTQPLPEIPVAARSGAVHSSLNKQNTEPQRLEISQRSSSVGDIATPLSAVGDAYETAKAWVASVAPGPQKAGVPTLVNVSHKRSSSSNTVKKTSLRNNSPPVSRKSSIEVHDKRTGGKSEERKEGPPIIEQPKGTPTISITPAGLSNNILQASADEQLEQTFGKTTKIIAQERASIVQRRSRATFWHSPLIEEITSALSGRSLYEADEMSSPDSVVSLSPPVSSQSTEDNVDSDSEANFLDPPSSPEDDDVVISDLEDAIELERIHIAQRKINDRLDKMENESMGLGLGPFYQIGEAIPTFSTTKGYGEKRKKPPVPLGRVPYRPRFLKPFLMQQQMQMQRQQQQQQQQARQQRLQEQQQRLREQQQQGAPVVSRALTASPQSSSASNTTKPEGSTTRALQQRLTMLVQSQNRHASIEELMRQSIPPNGLPVESARVGRQASTVPGSRNSLLRQLESEASQQESKWQGMRKSLRPESMASLSSVELGTPDASTVRKAVLAKVTMGIERRASLSMSTSTGISTGQTTSTAESSRASAGEWQKRLTESYMAEVPKLVECLTKAEEGLESGNSTSSESDYSHQDSVSDPMSIEDFELEDLNPEADAPIAIEGLSTAPPPTLVHCLWTKPEAHSTAVSPPSISSRLWHRRRVPRPLMKEDPAALCVRPRKRFSSSPLPVFSVSRVLWTPRASKPTSATEAPTARLWRNPKPKKPRSILLHHRRRSSGGKRVAFGEGTKSPVPPMPKIQAQGKPESPTLPTSGQMMMESMMFKPRNEEDEDEAVELALSPVEGEPELGRQPQPEPILQEMSQKNSLLNTFNVVRRNGRLTLVPKMMGPEPEVADFEPELRQPGTKMNGRFVPPSQVPEPSVDNPAAGESYAVEKKNGKAAIVCNDMLAEEALPEFEVVKSNGRAAIEPVPVAEAQPTRKTEIVKVNGRVFPAFALPRPTREISLDAAHAVEKRNGKAVVLNTPTRQTDPTVNYRATKLNGRTGVVPATTAVADENEPMIMVRINGRFLSPSLLPRPVSERPLPALYIARRNGRTALSPSELLVASPKLFTITRCNGRVIILPRFSGIPDVERRLKMVKVNGCFAPPRCYEASMRAEKRNLTFSCLRDKKLRARLVVPVSSRITRASAVRISRQNGRFTIPSGRANIQPPNVWQLFKFNGRFARPLRAPIFAAEKKLNFIVMRENGRTYKTAVAAPILAREKAPTVTTNSYSAALGRARKLTETAVSGQRWKPKAIRNQKREPKHVVRAGSEPTVPPLRKNGRAVIRAYQAEPLTKTSVHVVRINGRLVPRPQLPKPVPRDITCTAEGKPVEQIAHDKPQFTSGEQKHNFSLASTNGHYTVNFQLVKHSAASPPYEIPNEQGRVAISPDSQPEIVEREIFQLIKANGRLRAPSRLTEASVLDGISAYLVTRKNGRIVVDTAQCQQAATRPKSRPVRENSRATAPDAHRHGAARVVKLNGRFFDHAKLPTLSSHKTFTRSFAYSCGNGRLRMTSLSPSVGRMDNYRVSKRNGRFSLITAPCSTASWAKSLGIIKVNGHFISLSQLPQPAVGGPAASFSLTHKNGRALAVEIVESLQRSEAKRELVRHNGRILRSINVRIQRGKRPRAHTLVKRNGRHGAPSIPRAVPTSLPRARWIRKNGRTMTISSDTSASAKPLATMTRVNGEPYVQASVQTKCSVGRGAVTRKNGQICIATAKITEDEITEEQFQPEPKEIAKANGRFFIPEHAQKRGLEIADTEVERKNGRTIIIQNIIRDPEPQPQQRIVRRNGRAALVPTAETEPQFDFTEAPVQEVHTSRPVPAARKRAPTAFLDRLQVFEQVSSLAPASPLPRLRSPSQGSAIFPQWARFEGAVQLAPRTTLRASVGHLWEKERLIPELVDTEAKKLWSGGDKLPKEAPRRNMLVLSGGSESGYAPRRRRNGYPQQQAIPYVGNFGDEVVLSLWSLGTGIATDKDTTMAAIGPAGLWARNQQERSRAETPASWAGIQLHLDEHGSCSGKPPSPTANSNFSSSVSDDDYDVDSDSGLSTDTADTAASIALWTPSERTDATMTGTATANAHLWSQHSSTLSDRYKHDPAPRQKPARDRGLPAPRPAKGSLWQKRENADLKPKPQLWRPRTTSQGLWSSDGDSVTLADIAAAKKEVEHLWNQRRDKPELFAKFPVGEWKRSRKDVSTNTLPKVEEGLWRRKVDEEVKARDGGLLWGDTGSRSQTSQPQPQSQSQLPQPQLWSKLAADQPNLFVHLPTETVKRAREHPSAALPIFSESLWKRRHPEALSLWTPPPKAARTGLWPSPNMSLAQLAAERKRSQKMLWSRSTARRTTDATPTRHTAQPYKPVSSPVPVFAPSKNSLWKKPQAGNEKGLWKPRKRAYTLPPPPPKTPLWHKDTAKRTTLLKPERPELKRRPKDDMDLPSFLQQKMWVPLSGLSQAQTLWTEPEGSKLSSQPTLWKQRSESEFPRSGIAKPCHIVSAEAMEKQEEEVIKRSTSLWTKTKENKIGSLWVLPVEGVGHAIGEDEGGKLWTRGRARRNTDAVPSYVPRARRESTLERVEIEEGLWGSTGSKQINDEKRTASRDLGINLWSQA